MKNVIKVKLKDHGQTSAMLPVGAQFLSSGYILSEGYVLWFETSDKAVFAENRVFTVVEDSYQLDESYKFVATILTPDRYLARSNVHVYEVHTLVTVKT